MTDVRILRRRLIEVPAEWISKSIAAGLHAIHGRPELWLSIAATFLFYLESLSHFGRNAGWLYTGDVLGFCWPLLEKMRSLIVSGTFTGMDINVFGGSSPFYFYPNFFDVHPFFVLYALGSAVFEPDYLLVRFPIVAAAAVHSFLAVYFTSLLLQRHFFLGFGAASFAAIFYAFGPYTVGSLGEPMFLFCFATMPWSIYAALEFQRRRSLLHLPLAALPSVIIFLAGYVPLGLACFGFAGLAIGFRLLVLDPDARPLWVRLHRLLVSFVPFGVACVVVVLYMVEVRQFLGDSPGRHASSLFYSAHEHADVPWGIPRLLSANLQLPWPYHEFAPIAGLIPVYVLILFIVAGGAAQHRLTTLGWSILSGCFVAYAVTVLGIYGSYSPVSDMIYYLVPEVGGMHLYQRFLLPAHLAFAVATAIMLQALSGRPAAGPLRAGAIVSIVLLMAASYWFGHATDQALSHGLNGPLIFELITLSLFAGVLLVPFRGLIFAAAILLVAFPSLTSMYNYSRVPNALKDMQKRSPMMLDPKTQQEIVAYFKARSGKDLVKYFDHTPIWDPSGLETFPKSFPYIVGREITLSSYGGFNFSLTPHSDYNAIMPFYREGPQLKQRPDWDYLERSGADFVVALEPDMARFGAEGRVATAPQDRLHLPGDVVVAPLARRTDAPLFDNGYFRISSPSAGEVGGTGSGGSTSPAVEVAGFETDGAGRFSLSLNASAPVEVTYQLWSNPKLDYHLDGNEVAPSLRAGLATVTVPAGSHRVEVSYTNRGLQAFWVLYGFYGLTVLASVLALGIARVRNGRARRDIGGRKPAGTGPAITA